MTIEISVPLFQRVRAAYDAFKAISHKPTLAGRVHLYSQFSNEISSGVEDNTDFARVYGVYAWVHKAVSKTSEQIAAKRVRVVNVEGDELLNHPITRLFEYVNDTQSPTDLWQTYVINMLLYGESPFELVENGRGDPVEIWDRTPDKTHIVPDATRPDFPSVMGYRFGDADITIPADRVWFDKFYDPTNRWRGLAPIRAVREGITIDLFAQAWSKTFLKSGARPDFAIIAPQGITKTEREQYEYNLVRSHQGPDGWHKPVVLEEGVTDIKPLNLPPKDVEWLEQRKFARDEVGAVFGMPDEIMGFGRDTYENFNTAWRVWWLLTLKPMIDHRDSSLQTFFTKFRPMLRPGERIKTDVSDVGALQADITQKVENAEKLFRMGVPFEIIDERLGLGIGEFQGDDERYIRIPENLTPADDAAIPRQFEAWHKIALKSIGKPRVFLSDDISLTDSYKLATVLGLCRSEAEVNGVFAELDNYLDKAVLGERDELQAEQVSFEDEFIPDIENFLGEQSQRIFDVARVTNAPPDPPFWKDETVLITALLIPFVAKWIDAGIGVQAARLRQVGLGVDAHINARAADWAGKYAADMAKGLNATTRELAKARIANWINSGQPLNVLSDDLARIISPRWRAELIARTEVTRAYSEAAQRIADEVDGIKGYVWITARDERVCPICRPLDGVKRLAGQSFPGGLYPPAHPRCNCELILYTE